MLNLIDIGSVIVALIAAFGAWAAQRAAARATRLNNTVSSRLDAERGAYERARAFDIQTIERQNAEILILRESNDRLRTELILVAKRVAHLEALLLLPDSERFTDEDILETPD